MNFSGVLVIIGASIFTPYIYSKIVPGFINDVVSRLVSADFSLSFEKCLDLFIGYSVGGLVFSYVFYQIYILKFLTINKTDIPLVLSSSALAFCYLARIMTRRKGHVVGKQYLSAVILTASILFLVNFFTSVDKQSYNGNLFDFTQFFSINILKHIHDTIINGIKGNLLFIRNTIYWFLVGVVGTSLLGEKILIKSGADRRSIPTLLEKLTSDFITLPDEKVKENIECMISLKKNITSIRLISRSLQTFKLIYPNLEVHAEIFKNQNSVLKKADESERFIPNFKVIAPDNYNFELESKKRTSPFRHPMKGLIDKINGEKDELNNEQLDYQKRLNTLITASEGKEQILIWKKADMNDFRILIVNYINEKGINEGSVLVVANAKGANYERCALISKEPYIVNAAANFFDSLFETLP